VAGAYDPRCRCWGNADPDPDKPTLGKERSSGILAAKESAQCVFEKARPNNIAARVSFSFHPIKGSDAVARGQVRYWLIWV